MAERQTPAGGFTLIELLVALVVLGFLFIGLTQGVRLGLDAWNAQSRNVALRDQLNSTDRVLRQLISRINPGDEGQSPRFEGKPDRLDFRTQLPSAAVLATRIADASLLVDPQHRLVLRWMPHLHEQPIGDPPPWTDTELLGNVAQLKFSYWQPASEEDGGTAGWRDDWSAPTIPLMIKIHLVFAENDPRHWPDIVIAPTRQQIAG